MRPDRYKHGPDAFFNKKRYKITIISEILIIFTRYNCAIRADCPLSKQTADIANNLITK